MAGSSPTRRRSFQFASPQSSSVIAEILSEDRNSESRHKQLLELAKREHERVREDAERVYRDHLRREERQRLLDEKRQEEQRIKVEEQIAADRVRLHALKLTKVEAPPSPPTPRFPEPSRAAAVAESTTPAPTSTPSAVSNQSSVPQPPPQTNGSATPKPPAPATTFSPGLFGSSKAQPTTQPAAPGPPIDTTAATAKNRTPEAPRPPSFPGGFGNLLNNGAGSNRASSARPESAPPAGQLTVDRYTTIHKNLKELRNSMAEQAKTNSALKERMGDMRREIRKIIGQLGGGGAPANRQQQQRIAAVLREALTNRVQSQLVDPSNFVAEPRNPVQGAVHNDAQLPSLFIYLLNAFSKSVILQFIGEGGARPETADPIGVCVAATFSEPDFGWRGVSMIDILVAKFRIVCPVLFGYRGSEKTEQGRERLGWWKENGRWVTEQQHMDRMTGLGAGFAAVSLRKFAASKKKNPYPPRHFWTAMAKIINTPPNEISNTQCVVLKSMIQNYEAKFIEFYGTAAVAALRASLIDFPARAPEKSPAVNSLEVLAQQFKRDIGLALG
ncbi:GLE1-like protein-domain-containing protein [Lasiosphaeria ovina]|uniref:mRNA export factor GLE1 n=1 Tax=Lasiosphaeria ovina TaxID=92902 RepID=A0AAE0N973_9PEZI|nr:GLE1-like protein-domain-containing protein [Lasiosphaeria ovina]